MKLTPANARDLLANRLYEELQHLGYGPPKRGVFRFLRNPDSPLLLTLEINGMRNWGEVLISSAIGVYWDRMAAADREMKPDDNRKGNPLVTIQEFKQITNIDIPIDDREAWEHMEPWEEIYIDSKKKDIEAAVTQILDVYLRHGRKFVENWSYPQSALESYETHSRMWSSWADLVFFLLIDEVRGREAACKWVVEDRSMVATPYGKEQRKYLKERFCGYDLK